MPRYLNGRSTRRASPSTATFSTWPVPPRASPPRPCPLRLRRVSPFKQWPLRAHFTMPPTLACSPSTRSSSSARPTRRPHATRLTRTWSASSPASTRTLARRTRSCSSASCPPSPSLARAARKSGRASRYAPTRSRATQRLTLPQFWKSFFEASANTRLTPNQQDEPQEGSFDGSDPNLAPNPDQSLSFDESHSGVDLPDDNLGGKAQEGTFVDPYQALQNDLSQFGVPSTVQANHDAVRAAGYNLGNLSLDSPDVTLPKFTYDDSTPGKTSRLIDFQESPIASNSTRKARPKAGSEMVHPKLLEKILARNLDAAMSPFPQSKSSTPRGAARSAIKPTTAPRSSKTLFPEDLPAHWDGIANLSTTRLDAFQSPIKQRMTRSTVDSGSLPGFDSPAVPLTMRYDLPSNAKKFTSTPSRNAAAKLLVKNAFEFEDSPVIDPPSVMKNWATRGYDDFSLANSSASPLGANGTTGGGEYSRREEAAEEEYVPQSHFGEGAGTTAKIDDLLEGDSFARIVDDEVRFGEDPEEEEEPFQFRDEAEGGEESYVEEDAGHPAMRLGALDGPEDTLFGMPQRARQQEEDSFEFGNQFQLQGMNDMDTLHGGQLLDSEPFEKSPLAGRGRDA